MRRWLALLPLALVACKHEALPGEQMQLKITPDAAVLSAGDSILLRTNSTAPVMWHMEPEIGQLRDGWYKAPSTVPGNPLLVTATAEAASGKATAAISIVNNDPNDTLISFGRVILPLMESNCNFRGCHGNGSSAGKTELSTYASIMKTVYPYQPGKSLLFLSLIKPDPLRRMPPAGPLHAYRIGFVKKWIEQGAREH